MNSYLLYLLIYSLYLGTNISLRQLCHAVLDGAKIGFGVWGLEGVLPEPLVASLLKLSPFALKTSSSSSWSSSRGIVSALKCHILLKISEGIENKKIHLYLQ